MAIDIYTEPVNYQSPYRPLYFDVSSDLGTIQRMIADVYVNGTLQTTIEADPKLGETDQFRFEVGDVLQKYFGSELDKPTAFPIGIDQTTSAGDYYIRAFEVVTSGSTLDTSWSEDGAGTNYAQSTTLNTANYVFQHSQKDDGADYAIYQSTSKFSTNRPQNVFSSRNNYLYFGGATVTAAVTNIKCQVLEYSGFNGTGSTVNSSTSGSITPSYQKVVFGLDTSITDPTAKSLSFQALDSGNNPISEKHYVNINEPCDEDVTMYWQNHYGVFDSFTFKGSKKQKTKTRTTSYEKRLDSSYAFSDRGKLDIKKENTREYEVYSDTLASTTVKWLAEIGESVDVYIQETINSSKEFIPVNVKKVSTRIEDTNRPVNQINITYELSNKRINQLGG